MRRKASAELILMNQQKEPSSIGNLSDENDGQEKGLSGVTQSKKKFVEPTISTPINVMEVTTFFTDVLSTIP